MERFFPYQECNVRVLSVRLVMLAKVASQFCPTATKLVTIQLLRPVAMCGLEPLRNEQLKNFICCPTSSNTAELGLILINEYSF